MLTVVEGLLTFDGMCKSNGIELADGLDGLLADHDWFAADDEPAAAAAPLGGHGRSSNSGGPLPRSWAAAAAPLGGHGRARLVVRYMSTGPGPPP